MKKIVSVIILIIALSEMSKAQDTIYFYSGGNVINKQAVLGLDSMVFYNTNSTFSTSIPTNGLIAWYPFNGNANDSSGHGLNGTVHGATLTTDRFGRANSAYNFDASESQWIDCGTDTLFDLLPAFTISAWIYLNQFSTDNNVGYLITGTYNGEYQGYLFNVGPNSLKNQEANISFRWSDGLLNSAPEPIDTLTQLELNTWYNVIVTFDGSIIKLYVNGVLGSSTTEGTAEIVTNNHLYIGGSGTVWASPFYLNGKIDDILLYNRVLSSSEVSDIYNSKE